jgi:hypothetical protein
MRIKSMDGRARSDEREQQSTDYSDLTCLARGVSFWHMQI